MPRNDFCLSTPIIFVINYFGVNHSFNEIIDPSKIIVEDNVFSPLFYNNNNFPNWIGFNSFRKFSPLADGSLIKSSLTLPKDKIRNNDPDFSNIKYTAKDMKYNFLKYHRYSEKEYLDLFKIAENKLDSQTWINNISSYSLFRLFDFISGIEKEYKIRENNYNILYENLKDKAIELNTNYLSFFVLSVEKRDALRKYLFSKNIFCPIHWPSIAGVSCEISDMCLSIPIDSRYSTNDMMQIAAYVNKFYDNIPINLTEMWKKAYPNVDIKGECEKARVWLLSNTNKAKKDFKGFTNRWLGKACQNGGSIPVVMEHKVEQQIKKHKKQNDERCHRNPFSN